MRHYSTSVLSLFFVCNVSAEKTCTHRQVDRNGRSFIISMSLSYLNCLQEREKCCISHSTVSPKALSNALTGLGSPSVFLKPKNWKPCELQKNFFFIRYSGSFTLYDTNTDFSKWLLSCHPRGLATLGQFRKMDERWPFFMKWERVAWRCGQREPTLPQSEYILRSVVGDRSCRSVRTSWRT